jgi:hypothetical protein
MKDKWFAINDITSFIESVRILIYNQFGQGIKAQDIEAADLLHLDENNREELDTILTHEEASIIVHNFVIKQVNKKSKQERYTLTNDSFMDMIEDLNARIVSNMLHNLVNQGLVETAFDTESNDFVFWVKDENQQKIKKYIDKPEVD